MDYCLICGNYVPEGSWICPICQKEMDIEKTRISKKKRNKEKKKHIKVGDTYGS